MPNRLNFSVRNLIMFLNIIHDYTMLPNRQPKILMQAGFYIRKTIY
ncbi:unnamed protein product [Oikopleura dioica]|uniref:Uncharacterized protein n=1 Tax=Oikopleura dioica TaxID=34765 RepID=E4XBS5_OIKDI|nr:unnamed protein product [Oikopleura dioica]